MRFHACIVVIWCVVLVRGARDRSFQERSNSGKLLRQNAEPMYPLGAFDKTVPERNSLPQGLHLGALETGYPSDNEHLNHHRFATLKRQQFALEDDELEETESSSPPKMKKPSMHDILLFSPRIHFQGSFVGKTRG